MSHFSRKFDILAPRSKLYQGPYGRICPELPAWSPQDLEGHNGEEAFFEHIATNEMVEKPGMSPTQIADDPALVDELENNFSSNIPAGYTYFGQFVDHDITFDPASSLMRQNDPSGLLNHRTPRLDLDSIYGLGPTASPYLYDRDDLDRNPHETQNVQKLLTDTIPNTNLKDLPRNRQGRALIGDMRNDENAMISQLQLAFLLAHNELVQRARDQEMANPFERARTALRWLYQHIVWHDYIPRITMSEVHESALVREENYGRTKWKLGLDNIYEWKNQPFMPVEFSVAAYRFGHSMVRNSYQTNHPLRGFGDFTPIFDNSGAEDSDDLSGFRFMKLKNYIQWDWFLPMGNTSAKFPQVARKIDTKLANALAHVPGGSVGSNMTILAFRNLMRGRRLGLPAGTAVARKFGAEPLEIPQNRDSLWFYILKEAEEMTRVHGGQTLGPVGSIIVCATIAGLLKGDPSSYFNIEPCWIPDNDPLLKAADRRDSGDEARWSLASIIRLSGLPVSAEDFDGLG